MDFRVRCQRRAGSSLHPRGASPVGWWLGARCGWRRIFYGCRWRENVPGVHLHSLANKFESALHLPMIRNSRRCRNGRQYKSEYHDRTVRPSARRHSRTQERHHIPPHTSDILTPSGSKNPHTHAPRHPLQKHPHTRIHPSRCRDARQSDLTLPATAIAYQARTLPAHTRTAPYRQAPDQTHPRCVQAIKSILKVSSYGSGSSWPPSRLQYCISPLAGRRISRGVGSHLVCCCDLLRRMGFARDGPERSGGRRGPS